MRKYCFKVLLAVSTVLILLIVGCSPKDKTPVTQYALFGLHLHTYIDTNLINPSANPPQAVYTQEYADAAGRYEWLTQADVYVSNVSLHSTTKGWYTIPGSLLMKRIENELYQIANAPADAYDSVQFTVGLAPNYDSNGPSSYSSTGSSGDTVLSSVEGLMYGGSSNGYYFMSIAGFVDTTAGHNGTTANSIPFAYQLGAPGDTLRITIPSEVPSSNNLFTLLPNEPGVQLVHIIFDYGKLLQTFPITAPTIVTAPGGNWTPVWNKVPNMFRFECSVPNGDC